MPRPAPSLKVKLGLGAFVLALAALVTAGVLVLAMQRVSDRIEASLAAEARIERYSVLSTQISTFIVIAAESIQSGIPMEQRTQRLDSVAANVTRTFARLRRDLEEAVAEAQRLGIDEQSRRATQSIGIARMEALFVSTRDAMLTSGTDRERLQGFIDTFAMGFDPLLNGVITDEVRARNAILAGIDDLRRALNLTALGVAAATVLLMGLFYIGLVRPQVSRLDLLRDAARQIGQEDFAVTLPDKPRDEIGGLFAETNRMAAALAARRDAVEFEWSRLNATIEERTEALQRANDKLAQTDENRRRFFADISHELRTPLTVILMEAQLGRKGAEAAEGCFQTIEARALRLNRRIDDLLRIARSESGQLALEFGAVDLGGVARDAAEDAAAEIASAGMTLDLEEAPPLQVQGDRNWLRQVVTGLIQNAVRHARAGGRIALRVHHEDGMGIVEVIDNGPGIAEADQPRIFERFGQGTGAAKSEGFGIGLALARWVIDQHDGRISVTSPLPRDAALGPAPGTKIAVAVPLARD